MSGFPLNWIDWIIVASIGYCIWQGWRQGILSLIANVLSFAGSLWLAIKFHSVVGTFLAEKFGIATGWTTVLGYLIVGFIAEVILDAVVSWALDQLPEKAWESKANQYLGAGLSFLNGLFITAFVLLIILELPLRGTIKKDIRASKVGSVLVRGAEAYGGQVKSVLDTVGEQARKFLTVAPRSTERITLDVKPTKNQLIVDPAAEKEMLTLINAERVKAGAPALVWHEGAAVVARAYSRDMFERGYFSHVSPEGKDVGDRLQAAKVEYSYAGENLAYAPDLATAHEGLMNSEGHRHNILDTKFRKVGIGIIDSGNYGEMFTQIFID